MNILFICTHNRCRSILAEAITNHYGAGLIKASSAGSSPAGQVHPLTIQALQDAGIPGENLRSKSWDELENEPFDFVITVCDRAANEPCPLWFGNSKQLHWGLADPSAIQGNAETISAAFNKTINILKQRILQILSWIEQGKTADEIYSLMQKLHKDALNGTV